MKRIPLDKSVIDKGFWGEYRRLVREVVIPYQHEILWDRVPGAEPSHAVQNFRIACGDAQGEFGGMVFQDSDIAKWLEAVGYSLKTNPDSALEGQADALIDLIARAQQPDGYVNTYFLLKEPGNRFTNLADCHELYCLGHMIEAAVAYYEGTGKQRLLDVVCRYADLVDSLFGSEEGKKKGYPGHQVIELALVRLYEVTGEERYLNLALFFLNERGQTPHFFEQEWEARGKTRHWGGNQKPEYSYHQAHLPVREQTEAVGHAVRAVYMYTGMAMAAEKTGDQTLLEACKRLWRNIVEKQLYITGGIGQTARGEAFTFDYDLPGETIYSETCAAIGLLFFARAMLASDLSSEYADVIENALYNTVLAGMARDGKHFFYVNPLEVWPEASEKNPDRRHVVPQRPGWYACACCPPNVARLLSSLGSYAYSQQEDTLFIHLYMDGSCTMDTPAGSVTLTITTDYPWDGKVTIQADNDGDFALALRIPGWCENPTAAVNGTAIDTATENGYLTIRRMWTKGDTVTLEFPMEVKFLRSNPKVRANAGKIAIMRGPLVYCAEEADNGENLSALSIDPAQDVVAAWDENLPGGAMALRVGGFRDMLATDKLYLPAENESPAPAEITLIPYYLWGNRGRGEMGVWVRKV
jgi:DUF1680 family protein